MEGGTPCFFIIDEPLKGTNSRDKLTGTELLIKRIMEEKVETCGLLATHDLQLTNLVDQYPGHLFNKCLEVQIKDDNILCDYKIRDGVTRNMNAVQLMKKMKII